MEKYGISHDKIMKEEELEVPEVPEVPEAPEEAESMSTSEASK